MRIKKGFVLRQLLGEYVVNGEGLERVNFNKIVSLNETAAFLWDSLKDKEFDTEMMAELLTGKYEVSKETALADSIKLAEAWKETGLLED